MTNRQQAVRASTVAKVVALSLFLGGSGVGYVFQKGQIRDLVGQRSKNDEVLLELEQRRDNYRIALERETSSRELERRIEQFRLGLEKPAPGRTITLAEPAPARARPVSLVNQ